MTEGMSNKTKTVPSSLAKARLDVVVAYADSTAFGQRLENIFKIVKHFDAVLLLDEGRCDHEAAQTLLGYPVIVLRPFFSENSSIILPGYPFLTTNRMIRSVDFD
ncbi:predicted protein [Histoplasma capsulatum G186AR]|uniref:Uncharacterized protein n=1 Tax=Ajellomyces capsulatus (strain G186AR / H82 / ATCC MYA-2454 / RMSCC 2432) TaxID=447093 RepID=C0NUL0_AJECG|nr:uncharacterized protein HCBG_07041 [Histoplasma capsulatum G186AR]EEH05090.1 predicted protein [Histoplasma capsulatum G186AR]